MQHWWSVTDEFLGAIMMFFLTPIMFLWGLISQVLPKKEMTFNTILHKYELSPSFQLQALSCVSRSSGVVKPGEMCLVLGTPGAGCTTFLKAIANNREGFARVSGEVLYAGIDAAEMLDRYKGEVVYNDEGSPST